MKKIATLLTFLFLIQGFAVAQNQTFNFLPGEHIVDYVELEQYKNFQVDLVHPQYDDITFGWVTVENNLLDKWEYTSCDNGGCYSLLPDSALIGPLADTVNGFIRLTINPRNQAGTGTVVIYVYNEKFPDQGQFVTFEITATEVTSVAEVNAAAISVYPNPAVDFIKVKNTSTHSAYIYLTDISGKQVRSGQLEPATQISFNVANLPKGFYFCRFNSTETTTFEKIIIH
ncbi:MAG: T9SS type A sorting domain-containing protein [Bacteroidales bacterium]